MSSGVPIICSHTNILALNDNPRCISDRLIDLIAGTSVGSLIGGLIGRLDLALPFIIGGGVSALAGIVYFRFFSSLPNPEDIDNGDEALENIPADPLIPE